MNYNIRYYPLCLEAAEQVRSGRLGRLLHVTGSYVQDWLFHDTDFNWRVLADEGGALRAVADIGTHWLDLIHAVTGLEVASVCADLSTIHPVRRRPTGVVETFSGKGAAPVPTEPVRRGHRGLWLRDVAVSRWRARLRVCVASHGRTQELSPVRDRRSPTGHGLEQRVAQRDVDWTS